MADSEFPEELELKLQRSKVLRYGENPHQSAALYLDPRDERQGAARAKQVQGKELSYNNLLDADAAFECVSEFSQAACVIVKHTNPCGAAVAEVPRVAYVKALASDPNSAFGGIVALNRQVDKETAEEITKLFAEVVIAPDASKDALAMFAKKPNVRVLLTGTMPASPDELASRGGPDLRQTKTTHRSVAGGVLVQTRDNIVLENEPTVVTKKLPLPEEMADMKFAFTIAKHVKSNAIVYAKNGATVGIGAGQMSRIDAANIAAAKGGEKTLGFVMASDAFFPFPDVVHSAHQAGATAIIQPGGSKNDAESIDAADKHDIAMVFTGIRHFRH